MTPDEEEMLRWQEVICKCGHRYNIQMGECPMCRLDRELPLEEINGNKEML